MINICDYCVYSCKCSFLSGCKGFKRPKDTTAGQQQMWSDTGQKNTTKSSSELQNNSKQEIKKSSSPQNKSPGEKTTQIKTPANNGKSCSNNRTPTPPGGYSRNPYYQSFYNNPASMYAKTLESFSSKLFSSNRSNVENKGTENQKNNVSGIQILTNNNRQRKNNENENNKITQNTLRNTSPTVSRSNSPTVNKNTSPTLHKNTSPDTVKKTGSHSTSNNRQSNSPNYTGPKRKSTISPSTQSDMDQSSFDITSEGFTTETSQTNQEEKSNLHDTVNKFSKDGKGSSRHVLMLQQQMYQEDQQQQDYQNRKPLNHGSFYNPCYSPPPYSTPWNNYDYPPHQHDMSFDCAYPTYQHFGGNNYDYRPFSYGQNNGYNNQYGCHGNSWNQHNNNPYRYQRPIVCSTPQPPSNCTTMCSTVVQQKWSHRISPYDRVDEGPCMSRQSPVNMFRPINEPSSVPGACNNPDMDDEDHEWDGIVGPVELLVSNLDYNISAKEWRKILFTTFHPHVKVSYS